MCSEQNMSVKPDPAADEVWILLIHSVCVVRVLRLPRGVDEPFVTLRPVAQ